MSRVKLFVSLFVSALALVTVAGAVSVNQDYNPGTDFSKYKTFVLKEGTPAPSSLGQERIVNAIITQLEAKGLKRSEESPDLEVFPHVKISSEKVVDVNSMGYGGYYGWSGWGGGWGTSTVNVRDIPVGTLMVDLVDTASKELVWRGVAEGTLNANAKPEKREKNINKAVAKLFQKFPPAPKK